VAGPTGNGRHDALVAVTARDVSTVATLCCEERYEIGVRRNWPGALAEKLLVPQSGSLPAAETVTEEMGALVEPGANALFAQSPRAESSRAGGSL